MARNEAEVAAYHSGPGTAGNAPGDGGQDAPGGGLPALGGLDPRKYGLLLPEARAKFDEAVKAATAILDSVVLPKPERQSPGGAEGGGKQARRGRSRSRGREVAGAPMPEKPGPAMAVEPGCGDIDLDSEPELLPDVGPAEGQSKELEAARAKGREKFAAMASKGAQQSS